MLCFPSMKPPLFASWSGLEAVLRRFPFRPSSITADFVSLHAVPCGSALTVRKAGAGAACNPAANTRRNHAERCAVEDAHTTQFHCQKSSGLHCRRHAQKRYLTVCLLYLSRSLSQFAVHPLLYLCPLFGVHDPVDQTTSRSFENDLGGIAYERKVDQQ